jgi:hypothetical protein
VEITPVIKIDSGKICRLEIIKSQKDIPFKVAVDLIERVNENILTYVSSPRSSSKTMWEF